MATTVSGRTIACDGKTLKGSHDRSRGKSALHSVSAWVCELRVCIGLKSVEDKSNEIPAVQELIDLVDLKGAVVTADAMHCQVETAKAIIAKEADYIFIVKGNQPTLQAALHDAIIESMENSNPKARRMHKLECNRGRIETRKVIVQPVPKGCPQFARWPVRKSIGVSYRTREVNGKFEEEAETFISSREPKVRDMARRIREHWSIKNQQHYILDVTFSEDSSRIRNGNSPEISSVFRRLALNMLQRDTTIKDSIRGKRKRCAWDNAAIERLISNFSSN